jgi:hypothetical protein
MVGTIYFSKEERKTYLGVPHLVVNDCGVCTRQANPKSVIFTVEKSFSSFNNKFCGFKSLFDHSADREKKTNQIKKKIKMMSYITNEIIKYRRHKYFEN